MEVGMIAFSALGLCSVDVGSVRNNVRVCRRPREKGRKVTVCAELRIEDGCGRGMRAGVAGFLVGAALLSGTGWQAVPAAVADPVPMVSVDNLPASAKEAKEMSKRNSRINGKEASLFNSARRAAELGDLDTAFNAYNELIKIAPTFSGGYSNRANIEVVRGDFEGAIADYSKSIELTPLGSDTWVLYLNRGSVLNKLGRPDEAIRDFGKALELRPDEGLIMANRASIYESRGKWDMAINDYRRAVEKKPNDVQPFWLEYSLTLFQRGNDNEALSILRRVAVKYPSEPLVRAALAVFLFDRGELADAETNWSMIERPKTILDRQYLVDHHWPPKVIDAVKRFKSLKE